MSLFTHESLFACFLFALKRSVPYLKCKVFKFFIIFIIPLLYIIIYKIFKYTQNKFFYFVP